ncbi:MAG: lysophospholipid acyltransferase family protein [bacterium]|nr:lysophospholipid acyltransferase family protein [bacterium]
MTIARRHTRWAEEIIGGFVALVIRCLGSTWRIRTEGENPLLSSDAAQLGALWHRDLLLAAFVFRDQEFLVPVSRSRDGGLASAIAVKLGYAEPARGSSSEGGAGAFRTLLRELQAGKTTAIITDGPRGPGRKSKPGIITLARLSGVPITAVVFSARPALRFRSWDRMVLPLPFARVVCRFGEPFPVETESGRGHEESCRAVLDANTNTMTDELDLHLGLR